MEVATQTQGGVIEQEWLVITCSARAFTRAQKETEGETDHVRNSACIICAGDVVCDSEDTKDEGNGDGFDAVGWWIGLGAASKLSHQSEVCFSCFVFAWIFGPQAGMCLCHCSWGVFHCSRCHLSTAGGNSAVAVALSKDWRIGTGSVNCRKKGLMLWTLQKSFHRIQWKSLAVARLAVTSVWIASCTSS